MAGYATGMRYPDAGGLDAAERGRREKVRRGSGLLAEPADEGPAGHVGAFGERVDAARLGEAFAHPAP